jgi:RNA polymerase sigma factor (sigma-70 family)
MARILKGWTIHGFQPIVLIKPREQSYYMKSNEVSLKISKEDQKNLAVFCQNHFKEHKKFPKKQMEELYNSILPFLHLYTYKKSAKNDQQCKMDLMQESYIAMCKAVENFDASKTDNFFNYVSSTWVPAYVRAENKRHVSMFKYGGRKERKMFSQIAKCSGMTHEDQAKFIGVSEEDLSFFVNAIKIPKTLLKKRADEGGDEDREEYLTTNIPNPESLLMIKEIYTQLEEVFLHYEEKIKDDPRKKEVLELMKRVGNPEKGNVAKKNRVDAGENYTFLAEKFGVTRERVRQIACSVKDDLRHLFKKHNISEKAYHAFI